MLCLTCFSFDTNRSYICNFSIFSIIQKQGMFWCITITLVLVLLYHALFDYSEREPEIEEEGPEFFIMANPIAKRKTKKIDL